MKKLLSATSILITLVITFTLLTIPVNAYKVTQKTKQSQQVRVVVIKNKTYITLTELEKLGLTDEVTAWEYSKNNNYFKMTYKKNTSVVTMIDGLIPLEELLRELKYN